MSSPPPPSAPPLVYPLSYTFQVTGQTVAEPGGEPFDARARQALESVVGPLRDRDVTTRTVPSGRYLAVHLSCLLRSEEQRQQVYAALRGLTGLVMLL